MTDDKKTETQSASEPLTELVKIAAQIARREWLPNLEKCRTIRDAREVVGRMDDNHGQLGWRIGQFVQEVRQSLSALQAENETLASNGRKMVLEYVREKNALMLAREAIRELLSAHADRFSPIDGALLRSFDEPQSSEIKAATKKALQALAE